MPFFGIIGTIVFIVMLVNGAGLVGAIIGAVVLDLIFNVAIMLVIGIASGISALFGRGR